MLTFNGSWDHMHDIADLVHDVSSHSRPQMDPGQATQSSWEVASTLDDELDQ